MTNIIKENWQAQFNNDSILVGMRGKLTGILASYERMLNAYSEAEDDSSYEHEAEQKLADKTATYNADIFEIERQFKLYVRNKYGIVIT